MTLRHPRIIVICGGIGSGKSVVSRICRLKGFKVYDCDIMAARLMETDAEFKRDMACELGRSCLNGDGSICRGEVAGIVFSDSRKLAWLNSRTHAMVRDDIERFVENNRDEELLFMESAIPATARLLDSADGVWLVTAPEELRILRVVRRNGTDADGVKRRMEAQRGEEMEIRRFGRALHEIDNGGKTSLLEQISDILKENM